MSIKIKYIELTKKLYGGPSTNEMIEKIGESKIRSIMRGSDIGVSVACKVAKILGVSVEDLVSGGEAVEAISRIEESETPVYEIGTNWAELLLSLDCKQWSLAGKPERRILNKHRKPERRKTQHA